MDTNYFFEETFTIRSSEIAPDGKATLPAICNLLQEIAGNHALQLDFDISHLMEKNMTWVLHRLHVTMDRFPKWRDTITIRTWPSSGDTLRAYRDFLILDADGHELGRSLSYWLILNLDTRRPIRIPQSILSMAPNNLDHVLEIRKKRLPAFEDLSNKRTFHVRKSDLDLNNHVNNVKYIEWALSGLPLDQKAREIDIEFHSECGLEDQIKSRITNTKKAFHHELQRLRDQKIVARAISCS